MATIEQINQLLKQGDYLRAAKLADEHKIIDCRNVCKNLEEIRDIGSSIDSSIAIVSSLEDTIKKYESKLRSVKDIAFQMKEKEGAFQIRRKNFSSVCDLIDDLTKNLHVPEEIKRILLEGNLSDESFIGQVISALNKLEVVLQYKPEANLQHLRCVIEQKNRAGSIKSEFGRRFYGELDGIIRNLMYDYSDNFINITENGTMSGYDVIYDKLLYYSPIVVWIEKNDDVTYGLLLDLFSYLSDQLIEEANKYNKLDGLYSVYLLVRLSQLVFHDNNSPSFLSQIYGKILTRVKGNFDKFMDMKVRAIRESKPSKQSRGGVLMVVKNFEQFTRQVESLIRSTGTRRSDIDECYVKLVDELFKTIDSIEHSETQEMIRIENYKYLNDFLRSTKIPRLEEHRSLAKRECENAVKAYAMRYSSRPLKKLNMFFEGVQEKIKQGVKEEEVSFQLSYSRKELYKVLQKVTLKEVQKGLEEMYSAIEKHASEPDSSLMEVVWHAMQQEFVNQYEYIQDMIRRCYPATSDNNIATNRSLTFTIDHVLRIFSDIAQSH